jgi:hypothetical protein
MSHADEGQTIGGHRPNVGDLLREIYELLAFFLASKPIAELEQSRLYGPNDPVHGFGDAERDLTTNRLIAVAITIRILDDRHSAVFEMFTDYCGTITNDVANPLGTEGLGLRAACNKIIHARKVEFDVADTPSGQRYLHPFIYLEGTDRKKTWRANLDIVKFCRESAAAAASMSSR